MAAQKQILVIDDNEFILNLVKDVLKNPDSIIFTTDCGEEGYAIACKHTPDVIILDRRLKNQNGHDILHQLRNNPDTKNIPVTMISSDDKQHHIEHSLENGAEDYIVKPFNVQTIKSKIERLITLGSIYDDRRYFVKA